MPATTSWLSAGEQWPALRRALGRRVQEPARREVRQPATISERLLQCIWYDGHFHASGLTTADGQAVEIRAPGRWNREAGPDFLKAELLLDGEPVNGDVELHLRASDWRHHGHAKDPSYRGVVLHVVLDIDDGQETDATPTGGAIPRLALRDALHGDLEALGQVIPAEEFPYEKPAMVGRCSRVMSRLDHDPQVTAFFKAAAARRVRAKVERFADQLGAGDFEQVLSQALMTAMGHRGSKTLFFLLSKRVPVKELRALTKPWKGAARALAAEAVLLHVANLLRPSDDAQWDAETMKHVDALNRVWAELGGHFSDRIIPPTKQWHRGMRPASFPERRIAGVSRLLVGEDSGDGLFASLMKLCRDFAEDELKEKTLRGQIKALVALLAVDEPNAYWARRHTVGGKRLTKPQRLIGEASARSVVFNALLPLALLFAKREKDSALRLWASEALRVFPPLNENSVTQFMKYRLFGTPDPPKSLFKTELRQQALFHVFTDCCNHVTTSCAQCAFFARLGGK